MNRFAVNQPVALGGLIGGNREQRMVIDGFVLGTLGGQIGATIHGGVGLRYLF